MRRRLFIGAGVAAGSVAAACGAVTLAYPSRPRAIVGPPVLASLP